MNVVSFDRLLFDIPFLMHQLPIKSTSQLQKVHQAGICFVKIPTNHGLECEEEAYTVINRAQNISPDH